MGYVSRAGIFPQHVGNLPANLVPTMDYAGQPAIFEAEFDVASAVTAAAQRFGLPANLKLSVHSGSDKFSLYPAIRRVCQKRGTGVHVKTAGTTWLEEVVDLTVAGGEGLAVARDIYARALARFDELAAPYATVIDIDPARPPAPDAVNHWNGQEYANTLRHDPGHPAFNPRLRQLIHVAFKVAAGMGTRYTDTLNAHADVIG